MSAAEGAERAVVQIGAWPPPIGGVTLHIRRLSLLLRDRGWRVTVIDVSGKPKTFPPSIHGAVIHGPRGIQACRIAWRLARVPRRALVHIHVSAFRSVRFLIPLLPALFRRRRVILTIHDARFTDWSNQLPPRGRRSLRRMLTAAELVVVVTEEQRGAVIDHLRVSSERVHLIPAFLLEPRLESTAPPHPLPPGDAPLALISGVGESLYWWEGVLDAVERIGPKLRWALSVYMEFVPGYFDEVERRAAKLSNVVLFRDLDQRSFQDLLTKSDIFVRPTLMDGDSVALREALAAGKRVIASDAVLRPEGVTLFRSRDVDDLVRAVSEAIERPSVQDSTAAAAADFSEEILTLYAGLSERGP
jgi:glycosyltransferase involved in cell wall biosynthesis